MARITGDPNPPARSSAGPVTRAAFWEAVLFSLPILLLVGWVSWRHRELEIGWFTDLYGGDGWRVARDLTSVPGSARRWAHPLVVPLLGVPGHLLCSSGVPERVVASTWAHLFTAASLVIWQLLLGALGGGRLLRIAGALLLGGSFGLLVYGSVPETYLFGLTVLLLSALLAVVRSERRWAWIVCGTLALGFTLTHVVPWALCRLFGQEGRLATRVRCMATEGAVALALVAGLTAVYEVTLGQPDTFLPSASQESSFFTADPDYGARLRGLAEASSNSLVATRPLIRMGQGGLHGRHARGSEDLGRTGLSVGQDPRQSVWWPAAALVGCLLLATRVTGGAARRLAWLALSQLAFFFSLHVFYGDAPFAYCLAWTYLLLLGPMLLATKWRALQAPLLICALLIVWVNGKASANLLQALEVLRNDRWWSLPDDRVIAGQDFVADLRLPWSGVTARLTEVDPLADRLRWPPRDLPRRGPETTLSLAGAVTGRFPATVKPGPRWVSVVISVDDPDCRVLGYTFPKRLVLLPRED